MPTKPIAFNVGLASGLDELTGASPQFINATVDQGGGFRARPGIAAWAEFPDPPYESAVTAMAVFQGNLVYTTNDRRVLAWIATTGTVINMSSGGATTLIDGTLRPVIAVSQDVCVIAGGGAPQKITTGFVSQRLGGAPPDASYVAILTRRVVLTANDETGKFYWSGILPTGDETWDVGLEFAEAESRSDPLIAAKDTARELFCFGADTLQIFDPDPTATFTSINSADVGISARHSIIVIDGAVAWLDEKRQFRLSDGRNVGPDTVISSPAISSVLQGMGTIDDCWGYEEVIESDDRLVWSLPTEGRAFTYSVKTQMWSERRGWSRGNWAAWKPTCFLRWPEKNLYLVGLADGSIAKLSPAAYDDLGDPIKWVSRTGFDDKGQPMAKDPIEAQFVLRRGEASSISKFDVRWRDDLGAFSSPLSLTYGTVGDVNPVLKIRPCGLPYYLRQWEISSTATDAFALANARETFNVLEA